MDTARLAKSMATRRNIFHLTKQDAEIRKVRMAIQELRMGSKFEERLSETLSRQRIITIGALPQRVERRKRNFRILSGATIHREHSTLPTFRFRSRSGFTLSTTQSQPSRSTSPVISMGSTQTSYVSDFVPSRGIFILLNKSCDRPGRGDRELSPVESWTSIRGDLRRRNRSRVVDE